MADASDPFDPEAPREAGALRDEASPRRERSWPGGTTEAERARWSRLGEILWLKIPWIFVAFFTFLSFYGTWVGLASIIALGDNELGFAGDLVIFTFVALLTLAMVFTLDYALTHFASYKCLAPGLMYVILLVFSLTFGFAFYWQRLNASDEATALATAGVQGVQDQVVIAKESLDRVRASMTALATQFDALAERERRAGGTCGDGSPPGPGPRMRHRERRADEIRAYVAQLDARFAGLDAPIAELEARRSAIEDLARRRAEFENPAEERRRLIQAAERSADTASLRINSLAADPAIGAVSTQFRGWGAEYADPALVRRDDPAGAPYRCISAPASVGLIAAADSLDALPTVAPPELPSYVGAEATRASLSRMMFLIAELTGLQAPRPTPAAPSLPGSEALAPETEARVRELIAANVELSRKVAEGAAAPADARGAFKDRDLFPLMIASLVDLMLLGFAVIPHVGRRLYGPEGRRLAEAAEEPDVPVRTLLSAPLLRDAPEWARLQDYIFEYDGDYFLVRPAAPGRSADLQILRDLFFLWERQRMIRQQPISQAELERWFEEAGRPIGAGAPGEYPQVLLYRVDRRRWERFLYKLAKARSR